MTISTSLALFISMLVLALIPGPGVLAVVSRTLTSGLRQGLIAVMGIVAGDYLFILLALFGLTTLAEAMGNLFVMIKYAGAAFLIWLGVNLIFSQCKVRGPQDQVKLPASQPGGNFSSFLLGLLTTLGNPKAILFYASFFPAFLDIANITTINILAIFMIATLSVGGVMVCYAYFSIKAQTTIGRSNKVPALKYGSGALLIGSGIFVAARG